MNENILKWIFATCHDSFQKGCRFEDVEITWNVSGARAEFDFSDIVKKQ